MKTVHLTGSISRLAGGPYNSVRHLCKGLCVEGVDSGVISLHDKYSDGDAESWAPVEPRLFDAWVPSSYGYTPEISNALRENSADLVHAHGLWMYMSLAAFLNRLSNGTPYVLSPRGMLEPWARQHHKRRKDIVWTLWEKRAIAGAAVLHATAESEAESIRQAGAMNPIAMIPNGIELPKTRGTIESASSRPRRALYLSRMHPIKGLPLLLEAWGALRPKEWVLRIAGYGDPAYESEVRQKVRDLGLSEREVEFVGRVDGEDKWATYYASDLFILPSYSENFGIAVGEAMACGLPVITTRGTPWAVVEEQGCGWWVEAEAGAIAGAIREAISLTEGERMAMGIRGRRLVEERFTWERVAEEMVEVYAWVLGWGKKPSSVRD